MVIMSLWYDVHDYKHRISWLSCCLYDGYQTVTHLRPNMCTRPQEEIHFHLIMQTEMIYWTQWLHPKWSMSQQAWQNYPTHLDINFSELQLS